MATFEDVYASIDGLEARIDALLTERAALLDALRLARQTIQAWHGDIAWDHYQQSPEMKTINSAIAKAEGRS